MRVTIVGGGILGTAHALEAVQPRPRRRPSRTRGRGPRRDGAQLRPGLGVGPAPPTSSTPRCASRELWEKHRRRDPRRRLPARRLADAAAHAARGRGRRGGRRARRRRLPRLRAARARPGPRAEPRAARQIPCRTALFARRRGGVPTGACPPSASTWPQPARYDVPAGHRGAVRRRSAWCATTAGTAYDGDLVLVCPGAAHGGLVARDRGRPARAPGAAADDADRAARRAADHRDRRRRQLPLLPGLRGRRAG